MSAGARFVRASLVGAVIAASLATSGSVCEAGAPPPPSFSDLMIINNTPYDIGVLVTFWPTLDTNRSAFDAPIQVILGRVRKSPGNPTTVRVSLGTPNAVFPSGTWGISAMHVSAAYQVGAQIFALPEVQSKLEMTAEARLTGAGWNAQTPAVYGMSAYTSNPYGTPEPQPYTPNLVFSVDQNNHVVAELRARWAWDGQNYAPAPSPTSPIDAVTRDVETFLLGGNPAGCPCPFN